MSAWEAVTSWASINFDTSAVDKECFIRNQMAMNGEVQEYVEITSTKTSTNTAIQQYTIGRASNGSDAVEPSSSARLPTASSGSLTLNASCLNAQCAANGSNKLGSEEGGRTRGQVKNSDTFSQKDNVSSLPAISVYSVESKPPGIQRPKTAKVRHTKQKRSSTFPFIAKKTIFPDIAALYGLHCKMAAIMGFSS